MMMTVLNLFQYFIKLNLMKYLWRIQRHFESYSEHEMEVQPKQNQNLIDSIALLVKIL